MAWIDIISYEKAEGKLKQLYKRVKGPNDNVDNILMVHSLRPHSLEGHMAIYKNVLHHRDNTFPKQFLEAVGVYVSMLNKCEYCVEHHYTGMKRLMGDDQKSMEIRVALENRTPEQYFPAKEATLMKYAEILTLQPSDLTKELIDDLKAKGCNDGEILEINQIVAYFCYANRTVLGLGVSTDGDILGLSPSDEDDEGNWSHK